MGLRIVGAGLGRTGTSSLKRALETLLGAPCHHMNEVLADPAQIPVWHGAAAGAPVRWPEILRRYAATVDFPAAAFWPELADAFPDAPVLLSTRASASDWWRSADRTIFEGMRRHRANPDAAHAMALAILEARLTPRWHEAEAAMAAYRAHNRAVRQAIGPDRLIEWQPGDGWGPLCNALNLDVPDAPFPHENTTAEFRAAARLDDPA